jgi:hypothetical protein
MKCGILYLLKYIEEKKGNSDKKEMYKGTAVHETLETLYNQKIEKEQVLTPKQAGELGVHFLERTYEEEENSKIPEADKDASIYDVKGSIEDYVTRVVPYIEPVATEVEFKYTLETAGGDIPLLMYIDLIKEPKVDSDLGNVLCDYKVTGKKWTANKLSTDLQFMLYSMATGIPRIEIHNMQKIEKGSTKGSKLKISGWDETSPELDLSKRVRIVRTVYPPYERTHMENLITRTVQGISAGVFMPAAPDSWVCTPKWCEFFWECRGKVK